MCPGADIPTALSERLVEYVWYRADTRMAFSVLYLGWKMNAARLDLRPFNTIVSQPPSVHFFAKSLRILFHAFADKPIPTAGA
jgi:hypothetical protein